LLVVLAGWKSGFLRFAAEWKGKKAAEWKQKGGAARFEGLLWRVFGGSSETQIPFGNDKSKKGNASHRGYGSRSVAVDRWQWIGGSGSVAVDRQNRRTMMGRI
jgi:hypothetical protein